MIDAVLLVVMWIGEGVDRLLSADWWLVPVSGLAAWAWRWLRPTGKRRRPRPRRIPWPAPPAPVLDDDTIVFQKVTYADAAARGGGEADR